MPLVENSIEVPSWPDVQARLVRAQRLVTENDLELLRDDCHECSVAHQVACYLRAEFPDWHVDCEFNLEGQNRDPKKNSRGTRVRPDIIVHRRGPDGLNLVVLEVKKKTSRVGEKAWNSEIDETRAKLADYQQTQRYVFPVLLTCAVGPPPAFDSPELVCELAYGFSVPGSMDEA